MFLDAVFRHVHPGKVGVHLSRDKMEPNGGNTEQTKACELHTDTGETKILAQINLFLCIRVGRVGSGNEHGGDHLEQKSDDVESDKDGGDEAGWNG